MLHENLGECFWLAGGCELKCTCGSGQVFSLVKACTGHKMLTIYNFVFSGFVCLSLKMSLDVCLPLTLQVLSHLFTVGLPFMCLPTVRDTQQCQRLFWRMKGNGVKDIIMIFCSYISEVFYLSCFLPNAAVVPLIKLHTVARQHSTIQPRKVGGVRSLVM